MIDSLSFLQHIDFFSSSYDSLLLLYDMDEIYMWILLYVNDLILSRSSPPTFNQFITLLDEEFLLKHLKALHFLGVHVEHSDGLFIS